MSIVKFDILKIVFKKLLKPDDLGNLHVFCYILETFHKVPTDSGCVLQYSNGHFVNSQDYESRTIER